MRKTLWLLILTLIPTFTVVKGQSLPQKPVIVEALKKANNYWQSNNSNRNRAFWDNATYHTGNMVAYELTKINRYKVYSTQWADFNEWKGAKSDNKDEWRYSYGESDRYVLFGDWQICFQTYIDLFNYSATKDSTMIARAMDVMEYQMSTNKDDYWWWADGLYMVMPVMTKLYKVTGNELYLEKLYEYFNYAKGVMYDEETGLFYRDGNYVYPEHSTNSGKKDFWARGDGWVFAGLAKIIEDMPEGYEHKTFFIDIYKGMAVTLKNTQQEEGYWTRSLLDPEYAPGYETSGTAFFTYGMAWGINHGLLSSENYLNVVEKGWNYLYTIALQESGSVGYVQPIGADASPGTWVDAQSASNFGTGAFLLAASEVLHLAEGEIPNPALLYMDSIKVESNTSIIVYFNEALDLTSAKQLSNFSIDDITLHTVDVLDNHQSVRLTCEEFPLGNHTLKINNLISKNNEYCENGEYYTFVYTGDYTITASGYEAGSSNTPDQTMDGNYNTRWSCEGDSVWINYDLRDEHILESIDIAFFNGDTRQALFAIELSQDGKNYTRVYNGTSSGNSWKLEEYILSNQIARHLRLVCFGNSTNLWNSITEVNINYESTPLSSALLPKSPISIFPNPTKTGHFTIKGLTPSTKYNIYIVNSLGKTILKDRINANGETAKINKTLPKGIYTVILSTINNKAFDMKLIVV